MSFRKYLADLATKQLTQTHRFVLGNSSVDYDSFFGSIIMAFFLTLSTGHFHMPLIDCPRNQLKMRFQIQYVLDRLKIDPSILKFNDQFHLAPPQSLFNLYDHNFRQKYANIHYVIDHHDLKSNNAHKYLVDKMGSAITILYYLTHPQFFNTVAQQVEGDNSFVVKYRQFIAGEPVVYTQLQQFPEDILQQIIRNGILLDTFNLDQKQKERWTLFDKRALQHLQLNNKFIFNFQELSDLKFSPKLNKNLTLAQSLVKDYKRFAYKQLIVDYSIIYLNPQEFYEHYLHDIQLMFDSNNNPQWDIYFLMSIFRGKNGELERQMIFKFKDQANKEKQIINKFLLSQNLVCKQKLGLWFWWKDPSVTLSRKKFDLDFRKYYQHIKSNL